MEIPCHAQAGERGAVNVRPMVFRALRLAVCAVAVVLAGAAPAPIVLPTVDGAPWTANGVAELDADLDATIAASPALHGAHFGIFAIDTASGDVLYAHGPDDEVQPASTLKLIVGSAALDRLKPEFTWRTTAGLATVPGSSPAIVLTAAGDPTLSSADLQDAAARLGVAAVGGIYIDDNAFDHRKYPNGWTWDDFGQDYAPVVSAATLDENTVDLSVSPGANAGDRARVRFVDGRPVLAEFEACNAALGNTNVVSLAKTGPAGSDDTIDVSQSATGCPEVIGSIPLGAASETISASVYSPIVSMKEAVRRDLVAKQITVRGMFPLNGDLETGTRFSREGDGSNVAHVAEPVTFWTHDSKPLSALLGPRFWIPSDNLFGELLLKELGLSANGKQGTTESGIAVEKPWLASIGVDPATVTLADGCGMSQYDRVTARDLVTVLTHDWNGPNRQLVLDSLPVGGARGTIEGIAGTPAAGRVFAKTGSMMHVRGLAGYLATKRHGAVTFAFEVDDWNGDYPALAALRARVLSRIVDDPS